MSNEISGVRRALPDRPSLRHLKDQAKDLLRSGGATSLSDAQFRIAREYGFPSWPKLKAHVDLLHEAGQLKDAIDRNDFPLIKMLMTRNPELHEAPLGYGKDGPLTWVAECRVPRVPPSEARLAMAEWMIENGSDVHRGGDAPLMRAALDAERIPMMELLIAHGADVNAASHGWYPIIFATCEALNPESMRWLLDHGADPNCGTEQDWQTRGKPHPGTALDYLLGAYVRDPDVLSECIDILLSAGATTQYALPGVLEVIRGRLKELSTLLDANPSLLTRRFPELGIGTTAGRALTLRRATLLHVAAEFQRLDAATLLLERGADVNARALVDDAGVGGQTPIFHAASQWDDGGLPIVRLLVERGADLSVKARVAGDYESPGEVIECTALAYALRFPGEQATTSFLRERGAVE